MASATESKILSNYLLVPAQLPAIASLEEFIGFFPRAMQESPAIRTLYRDLQTQRNAVVDSVAEEIDDQVQRGKAIRRHIVKTKRREQAHEYDDEIEMERMLYGAKSGLQTPKHNIQSIIPELESAITELESQLQLLGEEEAALMASVKQTVGNMSDLRYGRLSGKDGQLREQVLEGLAGLQEACKEAKK